MDRISEKQIKEFMEVQAKIRSKIIAKYGTKALKKRPKPTYSFDEELERAIGYTNTTMI